MLPTTTGTFTWHGHRLAYEIHGEKGVPCLLMHGILLDSLLNRSLAERFAREGHRVVLLDLLGHGQSDKPLDPRELRVDFFAEQAVACLDHLGIDRAIIGGVSLGAITALQFAVTAPERCLALFIEMPVMEQSTTVAALLFVPMITAVDFAAPVVRAFAGVVRRIPRPPVGWLASFMNTASLPPEVIKAVLHGVLVGPVVPASRQRRAIRVPTLIIGHGYDRLHALSDAAVLAAEIPGAKLLEARSIAELRISPARLWPEIAAFLRDVRASAARPASLDVN